MSVRCDLNAVSGKSGNAFDDQAVEVARVKDDQITIVCLGKSDVKNAISRHQRGFHRNTRHGVLADIEQRKRRKKQHRGKDTKQNLTRARTSPRARNRNISPVIRRIVLWHVDS
ncbi:hypothetical protein SDC9_211687 [bioreactor metagenome]|uniref:Uncharacterized protein n=1 Tax=bioreactor metagenome TaxID=1076179 RepID=A0A645JLD0_9ZZZZ